MEKKNIMMIAIIVLLLILLGTIVGVSFYALNVIRNSRNGEAADRPITAVGHLTPAEVETIKLDKPISTNLLKGSDGKEHVIQVGVVVEVDSRETKDKNEAKQKSDFIAMIQGKTTVIRSVALNVIRDKTIQDMTRPDSQQILAEEILTRLQEEFNSNLIVNVRIDDMITS